MLLKTHFAIALFAIILFFPVVNNKFFFILAVVVATIIPDLDTRFSKFGRKNPITPILGFFTRHRGILHSLTFCLVVSIVLAIFIPVLAFGFFLGYSLHLLCDSFTKKGIMPFWPFKMVSEGFLFTGGKIEKGIYFGFIIADLLLLAVTLLRYF